MSDPSTNDAPDAAPDVEVHVDVDESAPAEPATDAHVFLPKDEDIADELVVSADPFLRILLLHDGRRMFAHRCDRGDRGIVVCAPALQPGHQIVTAEPLEISPSILCPDCGTHGFVRAGRWVPA